MEGGSRRNSSASLSEGVSHALPQTSSGVAGLIASRSERRICSHRTRRPSPQCPPGPRSPSSPCSRLAPLRGERPCRSEPVGGDSGGESVTQPQPGRNAGTSHGGAPRGATCRVLWRHSRRSVSGWMILGPAGSRMRIKRSRYTVLGRRIGACFGRHESIRRGSRTGVGHSWSADARRCSSEW